MSRPALLEAMTSHKICATVVSARSIGATFCDPYVMKWFQRSRSLFNDGVHFILSRELGHPLTDEQYLNN